MPNGASRILAYHVARWERQEAGKGQQLPEVHGPFDLATACRNLARVALLVIGKKHLAELSVHVGYLRIPVTDPEDGGSPRNLFIPFNLTAYFPDAEDLEKLVGLALGLKLDPRSVICISGSVTAIGGGIPVADIDYCEYVPAESDAFVDRLGSLHEPVGGKPECWSVQYGGGKPIEWPERPVTRILAAAGHPVGAEITSALAPWFFSYIGDVSGLGVLPITQKVLAGDLDRMEDMAGGQSWAHQEAPICPAQRRPLQLCETATFGAYVLWLLQQVRQNVGQDPLKAAKRALNLNNILGLGCSDDIDALFAQRVARDLVRLKAVQEVAAALNLPQNRRATRRFDRTHQELVALRRGANAREADALCRRLDAWSSQVVEAAERLIRIGHDLLDRQMRRG